ncbi:hypothetical protein GYA25_00425 [Candidatus Woesearchaeota archaeon]|nr:hypothetical protein [Candidatus Woesearchaeota archaeon]
MKLYHGSPQNLKVLKPKLAKGETDFENKKAIFLTDNFNQAALYALGKSLKGKTDFALPPEKLMIVGDYEPAKEGYVYEVDVEAKKGDNYQYAYFSPIRIFKKILIKYEDYLDKIIWVRTKEELFKLCLKKRNLITIKPK